MKRKSLIPKHLQLASVTETADALRIDVATVRDWCEEGKLEYVRWGKQHSPRRHRGVPGKEHRQ